MIKDTIIYKNKVILTVCHQGFSEENSTLKRSRREHIGRSLIIFTEECVPEDEWDHLAEYAWEEKALVPPNEKYNPYRERACANMVQRVCLNKPSVIWKNDRIVIRGKELVAVLAFIKKYTGMDLEKHPVFLGDMFLFSASVFTYHSNKENSIILGGIEPGMQVILKLKRGEDILQCKTVDLEEEKEELEVPTECNWDNHDIEIYKDHSLIYVNKDISYMRSIVLNMSVGGRKKRILLTKLQEYYEYEKKGESQISVIGTPPDPVEETLREVNGELVRRIKNERDSERFWFIRPGELDIAVRRITDVIFRAEDELWLIDSYFTDKGSGLQQMTDWLRLISEAPAKRKYIVFYCNSEDKALNAIQLKNHMKNDMMARRSCRIQLIQTKTAIHDRFVLMHNKDSWMGVSVGTSFNSLNSNHYCIQMLVHSEAKEVHEVLCEWMAANTAAQEESAYDDG